MASFETVIPIIRICVGQEYNITVGSIGIDIVLGSTDVICSVVESGDIVAIHAITFDENPLDIMRHGIVCILN
jgi:predicted nuclease with TOPRIM domain